MKNKNNIKNSSLINIIASDKSLRDWILRTIVLNRIILKLPDGSDLNYNAIQNFVEYKDKTETVKLMPSTDYNNLYIIFNKLLLIFITVYSFFTKLRQCKTKKI